MVSRRWHFGASTSSSPSQSAPYAGNSRAVITTNTVSSPRRKKDDEDGDWEQLDDGSSSKKIYVKVDLEMLTLERHQTQSAESREELV
ncbi:hypothetical protein ACHAPU_003148 [Fusarium lateritium]